MPPRYRLNVVGDFYVEDQCCTFCGVPFAAARDLFGGFEPDGSVSDGAEQCWVKKQPSTNSELAGMIEAMRTQELGCIRYGGSNAEIQRRLHEAHAHAEIDLPLPAASIWPRSTMRDLALVKLVDGALSVFRGLVFVVRTRRAWLPSAVPAVLLVALSGAGLLAAIRFVAPWVVAHVPLPASTFGRASAAVLRVLVAVLTAAVSVLFAASFAPVLSAPALSRIVELRERALGLPPREPVSLLTEIACGLSAQVFAYSVGIPVLAALWFVTFAFPPASVVTFPLKVAVTAALLAWTLLDYPLSTRGVPLRARFGFMLAELPRVMGFAAGVLVLFAVPLGAIVLLPAAVAAATEIGAASAPRTNNRVDREAETAE